MFETLSLWIAESVTIQSTTHRANVCISVVAFNICRRPFSAVWAWSLLSLYRQGPGRMEKEHFSIQMLTLVMKPLNIRNSPGHSRAQILIEHLRVMELAGVSLSPRHSCEKPRLVLTRGRKGMGGVFTVLLETCSWELKGRGGWHLRGMRNLWDWKASLWRCPLQNPAFLSVA